MAKSNVAKGRKGFVSIPLEDRLFCKIDKSGRCWEWMGAKTSKGYGQVHVDGKARYVHRIVYSMKKGDIPDGLELDHLCENPCCCNPDHLDAVTHGENIRRAARRMRFPNRENTHCANGHPLSGANLKPGNPKRRECKTCAKLRQREKRARDKALAAADGEE